MTRIESLDVETWDRLLADRDALIAGVCTPAALDEGAVTAAVKRCYARVGAARPAVVWVDGPISVLAVGAMLTAVSMGDQLGGQLRDQLGDQLGDQLAGHLWGQLRGQLGDHLWGQLGGHLGDHLWGQLRGHLGDHLGDHLWDHLGGQLWGQLRGQLGDQLAGHLWGQLRGQLRGHLGDQLGGAMVSGWWLAAIEHWRIVATIPGVTPPPHDLAAAAADIATVLRCHCWLPLRGAAVMSRQHTTLNRDNRGRLHNPAGPAWAWADGTTVHALEGVRVPDWVVDHPDPARCLTDLTNAEQRRVAFAAYGWDRAAVELGWQVIDRSPDPYTGTLYALPAGLLEDEDGANLNLLVGRNGSPHPGGKWELYGLPVGREHRTAVEAQASLWGITPAEWAAVEVTT